MSEKIKGLWVFTHKPIERILMELLNLDGVIEKGVFEIPSYQRGMHGK
ncbi:hypothetical protein VN0053_15500 [Helicobacter pylori]|nr:hypothetical protein CHC155_01180 [Helicobacter pylori]GHQ46866.1 hypothetical protein VN0361_15200 [Helicobacter pylori]